jgi:hypothetical protein
MTDLLFFGKIKVTTYYFNKKIGHIYYQAKYFLNIFGQTNKKQLN